jgi:hypothetical protein
VADLVQSGRQLVAIHHGNSKIQKRNGGRNTSASYRKPQHEIDSLNVDSNGVECAQSLAGAALGEPPNWLMQL